MKYVLFSLLILAVGVLLLWQVVITETLLENVLNRVLIQYGLECDMEGVHKGIFLRLSVDRVSISRVPGKGVVSLERFSALFPDVILPNIFRMHNVAVAVNPFVWNAICRAHVWDGVISAELHKNKKIKVRAKHIDLSFLSEWLEADIQGSLIFSYSPPTIRFRVEDMNFQDYLYNDTFIPLSLFSQGRGVLTIGENSLLISSVALEGSQAYARIKGEITARSAALTVELMPSDELPLAQMLSQYRVKQGHYKIPIDLRYN